MTLVQKLCFSLHESTMKTCMSILTSKLLLIYILVKIMPSAFGHIKVSMDQE